MFLVKMISTISEHDINLVKKILIYYRVKQHMT